MLLTSLGAWGLPGLVVSVGLAWRFRLDSALMPMAGVLAMVAPLAVVPLVSLVTRPLPVEHVKRVFADPPS